MNTFFAIFTSVFLVFGLYCAAAELLALAKRLYRHFKSGRTIDKRDNSR